MLMTHSGRGRGMDYKRLSNSDSKVRITTEGRGFNALPNGLGKNCCTGRRGGIRADTEQGFGGRRAVKSSFFSW